MANKRDLKKMVNYVCADIATECLIASEYVKGVDAAKMDAVIAKLADIQTLALSNIAFSFDAVRSDFANPKDYNKAKSAYFHRAYQSLKQKFHEKVNEVVKDMNQALPEEVKAANIKEANA